MNASARIPVFVVFGPTAAGKTAVAQALFTGSGPFAGRAEVISADSMQVYRGMDIGTAKPDASLLSELPHHLVNIRNPDQQYGTGEFVAGADAACVDIVSRGKSPVMLGGTGFYIRNFLLGMPETPPSKPEIREKIRVRMEREGTDTLFAELETIDPVSAARIHRNDEYRIIRALEVHEVSGRPLSDFIRPESFRPGYRFCIIVLYRNREELYGRIEARVRDMFASGLRDEFNALVKRGYTRDDPGMQAIGYREFFSFDPPGSRVEDVAQMIIHSTKRYAKRQETFINSIPGIQRIHADDTASMEELCRKFFHGSRESSGVLD